MALLAALAFVMGCVPDVTPECEVEHAIRMALARCNLEADSGFFRHHDPLYSAVHDSCSSDSCYVGCDASAADRLVAELEQLSCADSTSFYESDAFEVFYATCRQTNDCGVVGAIRR